MVALTLSESAHPDPGGCSTGCNPDAKCGNGLEKIYPSCAVRYGYMGYIGEFRYSPGQLFGCGQKVVVQTSRGTEIGEQKSLTCSGCDRSISRQQIMKYVKNSGPEFYRLKAGRILRVATPQDLLEQDKLNLEAAQELRRAREIARELELPIKMVACEHLLGGERVIYHFLSEERIDFRELVRRIAHEYHTRVEMHQVGARDEARLIADYEICGRECCCKNFLKKLHPVSMRMAKLQKATLDPSKVSGRCGRLRCCLRYEHEGYESLDKNLPKTGSRVRTATGTGTVTDRQILTQLLTLHYDSGKFETVALEEVLERNLPRLERPPEGPPDDRRGGQGPRDDRRRDGGRGPRAEQGRVGEQGRGRAGPRGGEGPGGEQTQRDGQRGPREGGPRDGGRRDRPRTDRPGPRRPEPVESAGGPVPQDGPAEAGLPEDELPMNTDDRHVEPDAGDAADDFAAGLDGVPTEGASTDTPAGPQQDRSGERPRHRRGRRGRNRRRGGGPGAPPGDGGQPGGSGPRPDHRGPRPDGPPDGAPGADFGN